MFKVQEKQLYSVMTVTSAKWISVKNLMKSHSYSYSDVFNEAELNSS